LDHVKYTKDICIEHVADLNWVGFNRRSLVHLGHRHSNWFAILTKSRTQASVIEENVQRSFSSLDDLSLEGRDAFWPRHTKCQRLDALLLEKGQ
jgi:hypothetical protein